MAARINKRHTEEVRKRIQAGVILYRLQQHFLGKLELKRDQLKSAEILLDRSVPKLAQIQHTGPDGGALQVVIAASDANL